MTARARVLPRTMLVGLGLLLALLLWKPTGIRATRAGAGAIGPAAAERVVLAAEQEPEFVSPAAEGGGSPGPVRAAPAAPEELAPRPQGAPQETGRLEGLVRAGDPQFDGAAAVLLVPLRRSLRDPTSRSRDHAEAARRLALGTIPSAAEATERDLSGFSRGDPRALALRLGERFVLEDLEPGVYDLIVMADAAGWAEAEGVLVRSGPAGPDVILTVDVTTISGRVFDSYTGAALGRQNVSASTGPAVELIGQRNGLHWDQSGSDGEYSLELAGGGSYKLTIESANHLPWSREVLLATGEDLIVDARLQRGAVIEGFVFDADGFPQPRVDVFLRSEHGGSTSSTSSSGRYRFRALRAGEVRLYARAGGNHGQDFSDRALLQLLPGESHEKDLQLSPSHVVQGVLHDESGSPITGVKVTLRGADNAELERTGKTGVRGLFEVRGLYRGQYLVEAPGLAEGYTVEVGPDLGVPQLELVCQPGEAAD